MVIQKAGRGRPSRRLILEQVDLAMADLARAGGLPSPVESEAIWREIWHQEAHNSTAIEGNTLLLREVKALLDEGRSVGDKALREYLEVKAYAQAAEWVYEQGRAPGDRSNGPAEISLTDVRRVHTLTVGPVWDLFPPDDLDPDEGPGGFRRHEIAAFPGGMSPPPFTDVPALVMDWLAAARTPTPEAHVLVRLAKLHGQFEKIHPFRDGNGRTGRLLLNLMLVQRGYPPAVLRNRSRERYLAGLRRADSGDPWPLAEMIGRAVKDNLDRFLLPGLAGPLKLLPITALAQDGKAARALRAAADRGRLRAVKDDRDRWLSTKQWVDDYRRVRRVGRPRKAGR
ncbi:MAG TPA: Fic family protein [Candidatus Sulfotelmatobacter sp.]|nr:Fic family protein [Candidatus Sulfotelmatobacter sp.]